MVTGTAPTLASDVKKWNLMFAVPRPLGVDGGVNRAVDLGGVLGEAGLAAVFLCEGEAVNDTAEERRFALFVRTVWAEMISRLPERLYERGLLFSRLGLLSRRRFLGVIGGDGDTY